MEKIQEEKIHDIIRLFADLVPGFPANATGDFDLTRAGMLDSVQRMAVRRLSVASLGGDPLAVAGARTIGDLALCCPNPTLKPALFSSLKGPSVRIRPLLNGDFESLYISCVAPESSFAWRFRGETPSREEFAATIVSGVLCQFAVEDLASGLLVGLVTAYEPYLDAGHVKVGLLRCSDGGSVEDGTLEGLVLLLLYVFNRWPLSKVYLEIPSYNDWIAGSSLELIASREANLIDYLYTSGRKWDMRVYALTRESFREVMDGLIDDTYEV